MAASSELRQRGEGVDPSAGAMLLSAGGSPAGALASGLLSLRTSGSSSPQLGGKGWEEGQAQAEGGEWASSSSEEGVRGV